MPTPNFLIEWSIWRETIEEHYQPRTKAKDFMFALASYNAKNQCSIGKVTPQLHKVLTETYASRPAFDFLLESCACIDVYPENLPFEFNPPASHTLSMVKLAWWKTIGNPDTYLVTEDERFRALTNTVSQATRVEIIVMNSENALKKLNSY